VDTNSTVLSNAYEQVVWVYRAINVLAEQIGNIPFLFSRGERGRENLITDGPLVDFYDHPHPQINRFQYWELRIIWLMLRGECFRIPIYSDDPNHNHNLDLNLNRLGSSLRTTQRSPRRLSRVILADPAHFHHIIEDHQLLGWRYTGFGRETPLASQVFLPEEVWFEKLPNPFNFWRGLAPLRVAGLAAQTDFAAGAFMKGVMENNGDLGLIVRVQDQMGPEQREQLKAALRQRKRRAGTADEPLLLWNAAEIVQPQLSSSDLQFLENRKFSRGEICAAFGVPEEIVTTTDNSKYDVMQGARLNFIEHRVAPLCRRLEADEDAIVKSLDPSAVGWFDLDSLPIMQKAQRDRLATARTVFDMGVPFNELNRVLDLGFRRLPWGDRAYVASKLTEVSNGQEPGAKTPEPGRVADVAIKASAIPFFSEFLSSSPALEPVERISQLFAQIQSQSAEAAIPGEAGTPVPIHFGKDGFIGAHDSARARFPAESTDSHEQSRALRSAHSQLASKIRRFFFEQRAWVLAAVGGLRLSAGAATPEKATHSTNTPAPGVTDLAAPEDGRTPPLFGALPDPEQAAAMVLPPELTPEHTAALRRRLMAETQTLREAVAASLEEGLRQGHDREQLAAGVRAIYNQAIGHVVERIEQL